ncbi:MAG: hypothetical protein KBS38_05440 [Bacteroidales bacterium]|nr:hypothetical protein [Candidatus Cacconaster caballi]
MKVFLLAVVLLAIGVAGMAVTILVKKDGKFPDGEISHNRELRKKGIICAKEEEIRMWKKRRADKPKDCPEGGCEGCSFSR